MNKENTRHQENRSEPNQYLCISPLKELNFEYKKNKFIAAINICNLLTRSVTFKIKTNAAKQYLVEPSHGDIPGKEQKLIKIVMTSKEELKERCHDRFMVIAYPTGLTLIENYLANQYVTAGNCVITPDRMQKLRLKVHFAIDKEISIEDLQDSIFTVSPNKKSRVPLRELLQTQTFSTAGIFPAHTIVKWIETLKNKQEFSQLDRLHYIPRRSKLSLSDENSESENRSEEHILQLDFSGIEAGSQEKMNTIGARTLATITPMFKTNHSHLELPSLAHSHIRQDICTDQSCDYQTAVNKSLMMSMEQDSMCRHRIKTLERKIQHQKELFAQMLKERDEYSEEINKIKFIYPKEVDECLKAQKCTICKKFTFQLWQVMIISVMFLIIGSVFFSKAD